LQRSIYLVTLYLFCIALLFSNLFSKAKFNLQR
jgi:hypothetical protein